MKKKPLLLSPWRSSRPRSVPRLDEKILRTFAALKLRQSNRRRQLQ